MSNPTNKITLTLTNREAAWLATVLRVASNSQHLSLSLARWAYAFALGLESQVHPDPVPTVCTNKLLFNVKEEQE